MSEQSPTGTTGRRRRVTGLLLRVLLYYAAAAAFLALWQRRLIYQPTRRTPAQAEAEAAGHGLRPWRNGGGQIIGWHRPATGLSTGAVLVLHGNAGWAADRGYLADPIGEAAPVDVHILEYPGYGCRPGRPSERSVLEAADEAFRLLDSRRPIYIVSESLGAGPAAYLAGRHPERVAGLMLFMPYNRFVSVAQRHMPVFPAALLLRERYEPARWLENYHGPVGILLAGADEIIPASLGRSLHDGYGGPRKLWEIAGARHNDVAAQPAEWWKSVFAFWNEAGRAARSD